MRPALVVMTVEVEEDLAEGDPGEEDASDNRDSII
jgi:hypothetical protein